MPDVGNHVDDGTAVSLHPALVSLAHENESANKVIANHGFKTLGADVLSRHAVLTTRIIDQTVDLAVQSQNGIDGGNDTFLFTYVTDVDRDFATRGFDLGLHGFELLQLAANNGYRCAHARKFMRRTAANAATTAGHNHNLAFKQIRTVNRFIAHI